jgi:hypothetical protein
VCMYAYMCVCLCIFLHEDDCEWQTQRYACIIYMYIHCVCVCMYVLYVRPFMFTKCCSQRYDAHRYVYMYIHTHEFLCVHVSIHMLLRQDYQKRLTR